MMAIIVYFARKVGWWLLCPLRCLHTDPSHPHSRHVSQQTPRCHNNLYCVLSRSFASIYKNRLWRNEVEHKKKEMTKLLVAEMKEVNSEKNETLNNTF